MTVRPRYATDGRTGPREIVRSGLCVGCGSCVAQAAPTRARMRLDRFGFLTPTVNGDPDAGRTDRFSRTCPFSADAANETRLAAELHPDAPTHPTVGRFRAAYVGAVAEAGFRAHGSSGGMVSWMLVELLRAGMIDGAAHVAASEDPARDGRFFQYRIARTEEEIRAGAKSRYYPVEMSEILRSIREIPGRYAVVGVPCFIKAVQLLRREDPIFRERIAFTLGLFCGHMKSARFVESFAWQMGVAIEEVRAVEFRAKDPTRPASTYTAQLTLRDGTVARRDWWNLADGDWGAGFFQNSACNFCDDVVAELADISFGDAWVEPYASDGRGTNVVLVRSAAVARVVEGAIREERLDLARVDGAFVERTQAAGLRQRREGLAYRLARRAAGSRPPKRVSPDARGIARRRKLIYRMRMMITFWSHRVFWLARLLRRPGLYVRWARAAAALYHGLAYSRGRLGAWIRRVPFLDRE
jgi:coenzyme F420-reducing hydrogenase beta subunit